jgi:hypothetical protein
MTYRQLLEDFKMLRIITRGFYGFMIAGLLSLQLQAASVEESNKVDPVASSALIPFPRSMDRMAFQPPASIDEQIAAYGAPNLMGKVIQGCAFVSPAIEGSLNRDLLNRLYGQMLALHHDAGIKMKDFYVFGLILTTLLENPDLMGKTELQDRFQCIKDWYTSQNWLRYPLGTEPDLPRGTGVFPHEVAPIGEKSWNKFDHDNLPLVIFDPRGHFTFQELDRFLLSDAPYLAVIGFGGSVHGNSINSPATIYAHDFTHAMENQWSLMNRLYSSLLKRTVLGPIFAQYESISKLEQRQIAYALYHALHENPDWNLKDLIFQDERGTPIAIDNVSKKDLGRLMVKHLQKDASEVSPFTLGLDYPLGEKISPKLGDLWGSEDLGLRAEDSLVHGVKTFGPSYIGYSPLQAALYNFTFPTSLAGSYTFSLQETTPLPSLGAEQQSVYEEIIARLPRKKVLQRDSTEFRLRKGDEVRSLQWVNSGRWKPKKTYTWDDVVWHRQEMFKVYGILLEKGLESWSDEPVPADILAECTQT